MRAAFWGKNRQRTCARPLEATFDAPVLTSLNPFAFALALAAVIAMFRLRTGMLQTLAACSAAGVLLYLTGAPL